jgi:phage-related protein
MNDSPEADALREAIELHAGSVRRVVFAIFNDGSAPAREFIIDLLVGKRTKRKALDLIAVLKHLSDNERHPKYKPWENLRQISSGDYRIIALEGSDNRGRRELVLLYAFEKHSKRTSRQDVNTIHALHERYKREQGA